MDISDLGLPGHVERLLTEALNFRTVEEVASLNARDLLALPKLGQKTLTIIANAVMATGLDLAIDPWAPYVCARHGEPAWDTNLANLFLCEECADQWQDEPFGGEPAQFRGEAVQGRCLNCNRNLDTIRLYQWLLCGNCERVARSIGRSFVAAQFVMDSWREQITPLHPQLELFDIDPPRLLRRTKESIGSKISSVDFRATDTNSGKVLFGIELKTGKGYIDGPKVGSKIAEFQLDNSDCDDILTVVDRERIPVYLAHAQVIDRAEPPTLRYVALGLWWTDLFSMESCLRGSRTRPRENRIAAYYDPAMFRRFDELAAHIQDRGPAAMRSQLEQNDWHVKLY